MSIPDRRQSGASLVELVMFIVIVAVGLAGILSVFNVSSRSSADPLVRKQALAIAEALLEEIQAMPFTYCDPDDDQAITATQPSDCSGGAGGEHDQSALPLGSQASATGEARGSLSRPFDNVSDYAGYTMTGIRALHDPGTVLPGLESYSAAVAINPAGLGSIASGDALLIAVTVSNGAEAVTLSGYRTRHAPNGGG